VQRWRRLGGGQGSRVAPRRWDCRRCGLSGGEGRRASGRFAVSCHRARRPARRWPRRSPAGRCGRGSAYGAAAACGSCARGSARSASGVGGLASARQSRGGAFTLRLSVERCFQAAGPPPPEAVRMPLGVVVGVRLLVTFVYVGLVGGPAVVAEAGLRRDVLPPVVAVAVVPVRERVILCAVEVDPNCAALTPCHLFGRAFQNLRRHFGRRWRHAGWRVGAPRRRASCPIGRDAGRACWFAPVPLDQASAVAAFAIK
jgi:hypothetical protein